MAFIAHTQTAPQIAMAYLTSRKDSGSAASVMSPLKSLSYVAVRSGSTSILTKFVDMRFVSKRRWRIQTGRGIRWEVGALALLNLDPRNARRK